MFILAKINVYLSYSGKKNFQLIGCFKLTTVSVYQILLLVIKAHLQIFTGSICPCNAVAGFSIFQHILLQKVFIMYCQQFYKFNTFSVTRKSSMSFQSVRYVLIATLHLISLNNLSGLFTFSPFILLISPRVLSF